MNHRGNHSIEFAELRKGLLKLDPTLYFYEPMVSNDGINHSHWEPQGGKICGVYRNGKFLFGMLRGFLPRHTMPPLKENAPFRPGWQRTLGLAVANGIGTQREVEREFGVSLSMDTNPRIQISRSEDASVQV